MTYTATFTFGWDNGAIITAQLLTSDMVAVDDADPGVVAEFDNSGWYCWNGEVPTGHRGSVAFIDNTGTVVYLGAISPREIENADVPISSRASAADLLLDPNSRLAVDSHGRVTITTESGLALRESVQEALSSLREALLSAMADVTITPERVIAGPCQQPIRTMPVRIADVVRSVPRPI